MLYTFLTGRYTCQTGSRWQISTQLYRFVEEIQADLDEFMAWYNNERTNQGRYCQGRTPMETFVAGVELYQRFVYDDEEVMKEAA